MNEKKENINTQPSSHTKTSALYSPKGKLLFVAPDYYSFNEVVHTGLINYSNYEVLHLNSTKKYKYKNFGERVYNFFSKLFLGVNIKHKKTKDYIKNTIANQTFDVLLINRPDTLHPSDLEYILSRCAYSIAIFWDSIEKIPSQAKYITKLDRCCSFDSSDCEKYNLKKITNFYFAEDKSISPQNMVCYLATYDKRISDTLAIFDYFRKKDISSKGKIYTHDRGLIKENILPPLEIIDHIIPFYESYKYYLDSKIILDIAHNNQVGLSFRPYEALGLKKKLITTNKNIINYDFYHPKNIFIIEDINNINIDDSFFYEDYVEIDKDIKKKYHIKNWIKNILSNDEKH